VNATPIRAIGLGKHFEGAAGAATRALRDVSFEIERGELVALCGPSGCGKSTLISILACADRQSTGQLFLCGAAVETLPDRALRVLRRRTIGVVFQDFRLLDGLTVFENVAFPLALLGRKRSEIRERVAAMLDLVGLAEKAQRSPVELSGGQAQRVAIARALVHEPEIILADEPTGNLDSATGREIVTLLQRVAAAGQTLLVATHAGDVAAACNRTLSLRDGMLVA
jgi:ABC-type lipoprotein export system ATPase subunit